MDIVIILLLIASIAISTVTLLKQKNNNNSHFDNLLQKHHDNILDETRKLNSELRTEISNNTNNNILQLAKLLKDNIDTQFSQQRASTSDNQAKQTEVLTTALNGMQERMDSFEKRLSNFSSESEQRLENIRKTVDTNLKDLRDDNNKKLDEMRKTVDEKLQTELEKRMRESFSQVQQLLEGVQKDIGSMRNLAEDVGGLKRSLTNVKVRGMMGEFQLESILSEVFAQNQYEKNAHTNPDNQNAVVEFAIKIPTEDEQFVYLPIDSKFPRDTYDLVIAATESGEKAALDSAIKQYVQKLKECAKDISSKYIAPPFTTDYAIMFLPTESMYADAVNHGCLEELYRNFKVYITGPSTISALLGSMQMSFNNIAIQKRAGEVFTVLTEVQKEFATFEKALGDMQKHLDATSKDLSNLMGTRTRQMNRKLNGVSRLTLGENSQMLPLPDDE